MSPSKPTTTNQIAPHRAPWRAPEITELPKLTDLTLQTGGSIPGGGDTGGSTVIP